MMPPDAGARPGAIFKLARPLFWLYALALFAGTHWPRLEIDLGVQRSDLWIHFAAFGGWCVLATACGFFGSPLSARNLHATLLLSLVYAAIDEASQALPFVHRIAGFDDYGANAGGIVIAGVLLLVLSRRLSARPSAA